MPNGGNSHPANDVEALFHLVEVNHGLTRADKNTVTADEPEDPTYASTMLAAVQTANPTETFRLHEGYIEHKVGDDNYYRLATFHMGALVTHLNPDGTVMRDGTAICNMKYFLDAVGNYLKLAKHEENAAGLTSQGNVLAALRARFPDELFRPYNGLIYRSRVVGHKLSFETLFWYANGGELYTLLPDKNTAEPHKVASFADLLACAQGWIAKHPKEAVTAHEKPVFTAAEARKLAEEQRPRLLQQRVDGVLEAVRQAVLDGKGDLSMHLQWPAEQTLAVVEALRAVPYNYRVVVHTGGISVQWVE